MINRLRRAWRALVTGSAAVARWTGEEIDKADVITVVGLALVGTGLWQLSHAAALIVPGAILLWMSVPTRPRFIERISEDRRGRS